MEKMTETLRVLDRMYPDDTVFGKEVRKLVISEIKKEKLKSAQDELLDLAREYHQVKK